MSKNANEINGEAIRQTTDLNFNNKNDFNKRSKIKIGKQMTKDSYKLSRIKSKENKNEYENVDDGKKNEEIVLKAIQDKWYIEFNRLIYSKGYSYLYLVSAVCLFILFIISLVNLTYEMSLIIIILCLIVFIGIVAFIIFDILIRNYIMYSDGKIQLIFPNIYDYIVMLVTFILFLLFLFLNEFSRKLAVSIILLLYILRNIIHYTKTKNLLKNEDFVKQNVAGIINFTSIFDDKNFEYNNNVHNNNQNDQTISFEWDEKEQKEKLDKC